MPQTQAQVQAKNVEVPDDEQASWGESLGAHLGGQHHGHHQHDQHHHEHQEHEHHNH